MESTKASQRLAKRRRRRFAVITVALLAAAGFIAVISVARARDNGAQRQRAAHHGTSATGRPRPAKSSQRATERTAVTAKEANRKLTAALARLLKGHTGDLAVGLVDRTTGLRATYGGGHRFHTASIVKADILASLLLRHQDAGTPLSESERELATEMIEQSNNDAATDLWNDVGGADGIAAANVRLGLRHTTPGQGGYWGLTSTTVVDQLALLADLTSARSPLNAASRSYELRLMRHVESDQAWGVSAAATPGTCAAVKNGWLPDPRLWVINSIGVIRHDGRVLLVAVLSDDQPTEGCGIAQVRTAAAAAADAAAAAHS